MTSLHTPGPWRVGVSADNGIHCVDGADGNGGVVEICEVWGTEDDKVENLQPRANTRLIAAAPELLDALTALVLNIDAGGASVNAMKDARAAIAKATGE